MSDEYIPAHEDYAAIAKGLKEIQELRQRAYTRACDRCSSKGWVFMEYGYITCPGCANPNGLPSPDLGC
jgi:hypothetical protein